MRVLVFIVVLMVWLATPSTAGAEQVAAEPVTTTPSPDEDVEERRLPEWGVNGPYRLDIGGSLGMGARLDDAPIYDISRRQGLLFGLGLELFVARRVAFGLGYEHLDLGAEQSGLRDGGTASLTRDLNSMRLSLKLHPLQGEVVAGYLRFALAGVWQSADLVASLWPPQTPGRNINISCEGSADMGFGVGFDAGIDAAISKRMRLVAGLGFDNHGLTSTALDGCVPGAGTATVFTLRTGLVYGLPL